MTCAKRQVYCAIKGNDGIIYMGENNCESPQTTCPRAPGEGYAKCREICRQQDHAEVRAMDIMPRYAVWGASAVIIGHERICTSCRDLLRDRGITLIGVIPLD